MKGRGHILGRHDVIHDALTTVSASLGEPNESWVIRAVHSCVNSTQQVKGGGAHSG